MPELDVINPISSDQQLGRIIAEAPIPGLGAMPKSPGTARELTVWLATCSNFPPACQAGLWLLAGDLDRSHELSQSIATKDGSFWHGIMHRREGDFWNAKYWFRRTVGHAVHQQLAQQIQVAAQALSPSLPIADLADRDKVADALVDCCQLAVGPRSEWRQPLERVCWWEWQLLFQHCLG